MTDPIPSMSDELRLSPGVQQRKLRLEMSDGVVLRVLEFIPPQGENPQEPVIVFVSGAISPLHAWQAILEVLTARHTILFVETREKESARLPVGRSVYFGMDRLREDLDEVLRERVLGTRQHCFAGCSLGATVILEHLARTESLPLATVLIAPNSDFRVPLWLLTPARMIPLPLFNSIKPLLKWYYGKVLVDVESEPEQAARYRQMIDSAQPARLRRAGLDLQRYRGWDTFAKVTAPVLVVTGESDTLHSLPKMKKIVSTLPNAQLEIMASDRDTHSAAFGHLVIDRIATAMADQGPSERTD